jgi:polyisoprenoid-binding protein YceI
MLWTIDPLHTEVEFSVKHMGIMTVKGRFTEIEVALDFDEENFTASSVQTKLKTNSLYTGDERRDQHLRSADFLDVERFPAITFRSTHIEHSSHEHYLMLGNLTIRDVTRSVTLDVVYSGQGKDPYGNLRAGFSATGSIDRRDFGLVWNVALETGGLLVGEKVNIALEVEAIKQAERAGV